MKVNTRGNLALRRQRLGGAGLSLMIVLVALVLASTFAEDLDTFQKEECIAQTTELLKNKDIVSVYKEIDPSLLSNPTSNNRMVNEDATDEVAISMTYSTDGDDSSMIAAYKDACETHGGMYHSLSFTATCLELDAVTEAPIQTDDLVVSDFPRCYGASCQATDEHHLFLQYTLRTTEKLNEHVGKWYMTCSGSITSSTPFSSSMSSSSSTPPEAPSELSSNDAVIDTTIFVVDEKECAKETAELESDLRLAYQALKPAHNTTNWHKANTAKATLHQLDFTVLDLTELQKKCESLGGTYFEIVFVNQCGPRVTYTAANVPRCAGPSCGTAGGEFDFDQVAKLVLLHTKTLLAGGMVVDGCPTQELSEAYETTQLVPILLGIFVPLGLVGVGVCVLMVVRNQRQTRHLQMVTALELSKDFEGSANLKDFDESADVEDSYMLS
jgi:hypothetical protein